MVKFTNQSTKEMIFDAALRSFAQIGYENSDMRSIGQMCNIRASSLYNHYSSKGKILEDIYNYYQLHFYDNKVDDKEVFSYLQTGNYRDFFAALTFNFVSEDQVKYERMVLTSKLVYMRMFKDQRANQLFCDLMSKENINRIDNFLNYGIKIGKFIPFDTLAFANLLVNSLHALALQAFSDPNYQVRQIDQEKAINSLIFELLSKYFK